MDDKSGPTFTNPFPIPRAEENISYIGDGVYAKFDGYGFEIKVNDHRSPTVVYLEPEVLQALNKFAKKCAKATSND
jgi:hypothetical protein